MDERNQTNMPFQIQASTEAGGLKKALHEKYGQKARKIKIQK